MPEKIKKITIIEHPFFIKEKSYDQPHIRDHLLKEYDAIFTQCAKEKGTHVILQWVDAKKDKNKFPELAKLAEKMPKDRLHEPKVEVTKSKKGFSAFYSVGGKDLKDVFNEIGYDDRVNLEGHGTHIAGCLLAHLKQTAEYIDKGKIKSITILGGRLGKRVIREPPVNNSHEKNQKDLTKALDDRLTNSNEEIQKDLDDALKDKTSKTGEVIPGDYSQVMQHLTKFTNNVKIVLGPFPYKIK